MRTGEIYIIKNTENDKVYIGQTTTGVQNRYAHHMYDSVVNNNDYKLQRAIKKYGKDKFYVEILESKISENDLNDKEIYYISMYDSYKNGYNSTPGGDGRIINNDFDERLVIAKYTLGYSASEIAKEYGVTKETICKILRKNSIKIRKNGNKYDKIGDEFKKLWFDKKITIKNLSEIYRVSEKTISRYAKKLGLPNRKEI